MNANFFLEKHTVPGDFDSASFFEKWRKEKDIDEILGVTITAGITLGDYLIGDGLNDQISPELYEGFKLLMGDKINSYADVKNILLEKIELGDNSVFGLVNKIKGQLGENAFLQETQQLGLDAKLASSGSQEAWDVVIEKGGGMQFVQVKLYSDPNAVIQEIKKVNEKISDGSLLYDNAPIDQIDFAVPSDIIDEVSQAVSENGLNVNILPINMTAEQGRDIVVDGINNVDGLALDNLFGELLGSTLPSTLILHGVVNAFLAYKGVKEMNAVLSDTVLQSSISTIAVGSGLIAESLIQKLSFVGGLPTFFLVTSVSMITRAIIARIINRKDYVYWLTKENENSRKLIASFDVV